MTGTVPLKSESIKNKYSLKIIEKWVPIIISLCALFISYISYKHATKIDRPLLRLDYLTVEKSCDTQRAEMKFAVGHSILATSELRNYLEREFFTPIRHKFGQRSKVIISSVIDQSDLVYEYGLMHFVMIENVFSGYCKAIEMDIYLIRDIKGIKKTDKKIIRLPGLTSNEILFFPIGCSQLGGQFEKLVEKHPDTKTEIKIEKIRYFNADLSAVFELIPRPKLESHTLMGNGLSIQARP